MPTFVEFGSPIDSYFEAKSFSLGSFNSGGNAAGGAAPRAQIHGMNFTKNRDSLSEALFRACVSGTNFDTVWVELYRSASSEVAYITYTLSNVAVSSFQVDSRGTESVALDFGSIEYAYYGR